MKINLFYTIACLSIYLILGINKHSVAQNNTPKSDLWTKLENNSTKTQPEIKASAFKTFELNINLMKQRLEQAPQKNSQADFILSIEIPLPTGELMLFDVYKNTTLSPALQAKYPNIKTYDISQTIAPDNGQTPMIGKIDLNANGFHALIRTPNGDFYIDPFSPSNQSQYTVYYKKNFINQGKQKDCKVDENQTQLEKKNDENQNQNEIGRKFGTRNPAAIVSLRRYRLALACTGEYAQFHIARNPANPFPKTVVLSAMATSINRVNFLYQQDVAVTMQIIETNDTLIFLNPNTDPYTNNDGGAMLTQNRNTCNARVGFANYDIGHVFSTGGGGVAGLGVVCGTSKASGVTGSGSPINDPFDIDYVAHEVGHQFNANHTFNSVTGSCGGNRSGGKAYEPGSGTTIMSYAGICGADDIQPNSDAFFHAASIEEIRILLNQTTCAAIETSQNNTPIVSLPQTGFTIPKSTPFALTATASDPDNNPLTYLWEQYDLGTGGTPNAPVGQAPLFRSYPATPNPTRTFPRLIDLLTNTQRLGEILPTYTRTLNFKATARDNQIPSGGTTISALYTLNVNANAGPFLVNEPNTSAALWNTGSYRFVRWSVANTNLTPINCQNVKISLSTDGGQTFAYTLSSSTPNDGSELINIPSNIPNTTQARVKIEALNNVFFDVSNANFTINTPTGNTFDFLVQTPNNAVCSGDSIVYLIGVNKIGSFMGNVLLSVNGLPAGTNQFFTQNNQQPPYIATLVITNTQNTPASTFNINIIGTSGTTTASFTTSLSILNANTLPITSLTIPPNNTSMVSIYPPLRWNSTASTGYSYAVEIATDSLFANTVANHPTANALALQIPRPLNYNTIYFWRIKTSNTCGAFGYSATKKFRTEALACTTYTSTNVPITIPINPGTVTSDMVIAGGITNIKDIDVTDIVGTHTNIKDLEFGLQAPNGIIQKLVIRPCDTEDNFSFSFDDEAALKNLTCPPTDGKYYKPLNPLSTFDGLNANGTWKLRVRDYVLNDNGQLQGWKLKVCACAANSTAINLTLQPASMTRCEGDSMVLKVTTATPYAAVQYQWFVNGSPIANSNDSIYIQRNLQTSSGDNYQCVVSNNCERDTSATAFVVVNPLPSFAVASVGNVLSVVPNAPSATWTYQWFFNGMPINNATASTLAINMGGSYTVAVSNGGCPKTSLPVVITGAQ